MDPESIVETIQKSVINTRLIMVCSGASVPHGLQVCVYWATIYERDLWD